MKISVSSLGFCGGLGFQMPKLPKNLGIEIFYEWGGEKYWDIILENAYKEGRTGAFSIHAPYQGDIVEMSLTENEQALFDYLRQPFDLYHKYNGTGYVVHMNGPYAQAPTPEEKADRLKRVEDRLAKMNDICKSEGVNMLVENLAFGPIGKTLCTQEDFLAIFAHNPELKCIVDTGHAVLGDIDIFEVQKALGSRLMAYHMHDNNGVTDGHQRICTGVIDWDHFFEGASRYTPEADFVMEYNGPCVSTIGDYGVDAETMRRYMNKYKV